MAGLGAPGTAPAGSGDAALAARCGSGASQASQVTPGTRASDADRERAIGTLRDCFTEGRLTQDTFLGRVDAALRARDQRELAGLVADLPRRRRLAEAATQAARDFRLAVQRVEDRIVARYAGRTGPAGSGRPAAARATAARAAAAHWLTSAATPLMLPVGERTRFTIGRDNGCDLTLRDSTVSRWHAGLHRAANGWLLSDLGSTNGTRLNGWRVTGPVPVRAGDYVTFGALTFVLAERG
jgi:hypothetical protein